MSDNRRVTLVDGYSGKPRGEPRTNGLQGRSTGDRPSPPPPPKSATSVVRPPRASSD